MAKYYPVDAGQLLLGPLNEFLAEKRARTERESTRERAYQEQATEREERRRQHEEMISHRERMSRATERGRAFSMEADRGAAYLEDQNRRQRQRPAQPMTPPPMAAPPMAAPPMAAPPMATVSPPVSRARQLRTLGALPPLSEADKLIEGTFERHRTPEIMGLMEPPKAAAAPAPTAAPPAYPAPQPGAGPAQPGVEALRKLGRKKEARRKEEGAEKRRLAMADVLRPFAGPLADRVLRGEEVPKPEVVAYWNASQALKKSRIGAARSGQRAGQQIVGLQKSLDRALELGDRGTAVKSHTALQRLLGTPEPSSASAVAAVDSMLAGVENVRNIQMEKYGFGQSVRALQIARQEHTAATKAADDLKRDQRPGARARADRNLNKAKSAYNAARSRFRKERPDRNLSDPQGVEVLNEVRGFLGLERKLQGRVGTTGKTGRAITQEDVDIATAEMIERFHTQLKATEEYERLSPAAKRSIENVLSAETPEERQSALSELTLVIGPQEGKLGEYFEEAFR